MIIRLMREDQSRFLAAVFVAIAITGGLSASEQNESPYRERWVYCGTNLQVDRSTDDMIALIQRASRARGSRAGIVSS
jgi:hypothetical protein